MVSFYNIKVLEYYRRLAICSHCIFPLCDILRKTGEGKVRFPCIGIDGV